MKEFKVNNFLTLKLEAGKTKIYVNDELFEHCKFLMLNIPIEETENFGDIESIDEAADILGWRDNGQEGVEYEIDSETEFWGHSSNLQAWYENNYDTRILHSNLAFHLLEELAFVGDPLAKKVFKEEIVKRFESGYPTVIIYIFKEKLLDWLSREERNQIIKQNFSVLLKSLKKLAKDDMYDIFCRLLEIAEENKWVEVNFPIFLEVIPSLHNQDKYWAFIDLITPIKNTKLWYTYNAQIKALFLILIKGINELPVYERYRIFSSLFNLVKESKLVNNILPSFLEPLCKLSDENKYDIFYALINSIKIFSLLIGSILSTNKLDEYHSQITNSFLELLKAFECLPDHAMGRIWGDSHFFTRNNIFLDLIKSIQGTTLVGENQPQIKAQFKQLLLSMVDENLEKYNKPYYGCDTKAERSTIADIKKNLYFNLLKVTKIIGFKEEYVLTFIKAIFALPEDAKFYAYFVLMKNISEMHEVTFEANQKEIIKNFFKTNNRLPPKEIDTFNRALNKLLDLKAPYDERLQS